MKIPFWNPSSSSNKKKDAEIPTLDMSQAISRNTRPDPDSLDFSAEDAPRSPSDWDTIQELRRTVMKQTIALGKSSRSSRFIVAVSFATGVALSGAGATLYGQSSPDSPLQAAMSFLAKKLSSDKTGYDIVSESRGNDQTLRDQKALVEKQNTEIARLKQMVGLYEEMTTIQKNLIAGFQEKANAPAVVRKVTNAPVVTKIPPVAKASLAMSVELSEPSTPNLQQLDEVFDRVSQLRQHVLSEIQDPNLEIRVRKTSQNHVHVYLTYHGQDSLGFHAEMPQFANRLSITGMKQWVGENISQLQTVNLIQSVATTRNIGNPEFSSVSIQTRRLYSGGVEVTLTDSFSGRTGKFKVVNGASQADIESQMDGVLSEFLD